MSLLDAIILGIVQGLTEFLPVSSSGHLKLIEYILGYQQLDRLILFDLACHVGTLFSICIFFRKELYEALSPKTTRFWQVFLATLPLFPLVFLMKPIKAAYNTPELLGYFFLGTAALLWSGTLLGWLAPSQALEQRRWRDALAIGCSQALAILPGVSRSGTTITAGRLLGWDPQQAVTFSFLLAIPAIVGGTVYELLSLFSHPSASMEQIGINAFIVGALSAFIIGYGALHLLMKLAIKNRFGYFAIYCGLLGLSLIFYFNFIR